MNQALLYVRVSSKEQEKEGYSLDAQEKLGLDYAKRNGLEIVRTWKVSESAWNQQKDRVAFIQMIEYAKKHPEIGHIIFDITDRMTRNDFDKMKIIDLIHSYNKTFHFSRSNKVYNRNSGSDDLFVLDIEVAVAKRMSNDISRKTKMGMQEKAAQGVYPGGSPIGYRQNPQTKQHEFDENAHHIKKAFQLIVSESFSIEMTCDELYKDGLRGKKNNRFGSGAMCRVLKSPFYYGAFMFKGKLYEGNHPPLISKEMFDKANEVLRGRGRPYKQPKGFAFANLFTCGHCGCKILGELKKKKYLYYHCSFSKGRHDEIGYIPEDKLSQMLEDTVRQVTIQDNVYEWLKELIKEAS